MYKDDLLDIFNLREGGLAIYGGVIAAVISIFVLAKVKHLSPFQIFDTIAMALLNGQMLGRWGNFFNREAFGEYTDRLFAMRLPVDAVRSGDITEKMREHMERINGVSYIQVHPTFLYESLWCAVLLIILVLYRKHKNMRENFSCCICSDMVLEESGSKDSAQISFFFRELDYRYLSYLREHW